MLLATDVWGDVPTWIAAIGTVSAVIVALYLSERDSRQRRRERQRQQAEGITAWLQMPSVKGPDDEQGPVTSAAVVIRNDSNQLAYRVIASLAGVRGTVPPNHREFVVFIGELPPGTTQRTIAYPGGGGFIRWAVELAFRDAAGRRWVRGVDGRLREIDEEPAEHYGLSEPIDW